MGSILIVDDELRSLQLLAQLLAEHGYIIYTAFSGEQGLAYAHQLGATLDLILLDIVMPGMNGYEVCRRLKGASDTREIPVVFLSALDQVEAKVEGLEAGGVDYIAKPFHLSEIVARVRVHARVHRVQRQLREQNARLQETLGRQEDSVCIQTTHGTLQINRRQWCVRFRDREMGLARSEFIVLLELARAGGTVVARERLQAVTNGASPVAVRNIIKRLRAQLPIIETVRGIGYRLCC